jgi:LysM repeat protein
MCSTRGFEEEPMSTITVSAGLPAVRRARVRPVVAGADVRPARGAGCTEQAPPVRLTRRGRLLLTLLAVVTLVAAGVLAAGGPSAIAGTEPGTAATAERVTVRPGDTLWAIAERAAPGVDPRETIAQILDLNALESSAVRAGSVLLVPAD